MKVIIASDMSGFHLKEEVRRFLTAEGYEVEDVGQRSEEEPMLYYDAASALARRIQEGAAGKGIVICGTGAGVSMIANKHKGVYCVACESVYTAEKISLINNANVLAMGEKVVSPAMACEMAKSFLDGVWCQGFAPERKANNENGYAMLQKIEAEQ